MAADYTCTGCLREAWNSSALVSVGTPPRNCIKRSTSTEHGSGLRHAGTMSSAVVLRESFVQPCAVSPLLQASPRAAKLESFFFYFDALCHALIAPVGLSSSI